MRLAKHGLGKRIKGDLRIEFAKLDLTSYSGLELLKRFFRTIRLNSRVRKAFRSHDLGGDYSVTGMILLLMAILFVGGDRLMHVRWLAEDPLVKRLCELSKIPTDKTLSRWLTRFTNDSIQALVTLNSEIVFEKLQTLRLSTITLELDGTVLTTGAKVAWAFRGYNPQNKHAKSYFPLLVHIAQTGHFLQVKNRPGNIHDGTSFALQVLRDCIEQVRKNLPEVRIEVRMDSAFFQEDILKYLLREKIRFAVKVPMWPCMKLKEVINARKRWFHSGKRLAWFEKPKDLDFWGIEDLAMTFFREKISDKPKKGHQFDLFTPDDGVYEYSVICSNTGLGAANLFDFYNGRAALEHNIAELKGEFAFDSIPTHDYQGNSAFQQISILAHNLTRNFQIDTGIATPRKPGRSRTNVLAFNSLKTLRFESINVAGRLVNTNGRPTLKINACRPRQQLYGKITKAIERMAA